VHHDDDTKTPLPTLLDTISTQRYLSVAKDKLSVKYVGKGNHTQDFGAIRSDFPCPQRCALYYYEMTIVDAGVRGCIAFGLCDGNFPLNRPPGLEPRSYAYHGEDGRKFSDSERGESYGPGFTTGDVVGCGLLCGSREVFFTKNGTHLGVAFTAVCAGLFPTVSLHSANEAVALNFGAEPFKFDVISLMASVRDAHRAEVCRQPLPAASVRALVRDYLLHYTYSDTLEVFDSTSDSAHAPSLSNGVKRDGKNGHDGVVARPHSPDAMDTDSPAPNSPHQNGCSRADDAAIGSMSLRQRQMLRQLVLKGDIAAALDACEECFPGMLARHEEVHFLLHSQAFIELILQRKPLDAISYAQRHLAEHRASADEGRRAALHALLSLLAYAEPWRPEVPVSHLATNAQRERVADALNNAVLKDLGASAQSGIERLLRQLVALC